jgi:hypothetical protein
MHKQRGKAALFVKSFTASWLSCQLPQSSGSVFRNL